MFKCGRCGEKFEALPKGVLRCPVCAYKVIFKLRDPITKKIQAR